MYTDILVFVFRFKIGPTVVRIGYVDYFECDQRECTIKRCELTPIIW